MENKLYGDIVLNDLPSKSILATDSNGKVIEGTFPAEADTLQTVTDRGASTTTVSTFSTAIKTPKIYPSADSTTAVGIFKADGTTAVMTIDTTNSRLGVGINTPTSTLTAKGALSFVVSGTLSPDATGTYTYGGTYGGYNYYQNGSYYLFYRTGSGQWWISTGGLGVFTGWYVANTFSSPPQTGWLAFGGPTGTPTVSGHLLNLVSGSGANSLVVSQTGDFNFGSNYLTIHGSTGFTSFGTALYVDNANARVGIKNTAPTTPLSITVDAGGNGFDIVYGTSSFYFQAGGIYGASLLSAGNASSKGYVLGTKAGTGATAAGQWVRFLTNNTERLTIDNAGLIGINSVTPATWLHVIGTTEQLRLGYDASNYLSATVGSTGSTTFALTGTTPTFTFSQGVTFSDGITIADAKNIALNTTTGTKIGTATGQKLGFWNVTPVSQQAHIADASGGLVVDTEARAAIASINALLATLGLTASA